MVCYGKLHWREIGTISSKKFRIKILRGNFSYTFLNISTPLKYLGREVAIARLILLVLLLHKVCHFLS